MRKTYRWSILVVGIVLILSGCQGSRREEYRKTGIEQMQGGDYAAAMVSFEQALELSKGKVSVFELDVLKYRAEAEYLLGDYRAAAHTYDVLQQVDEVNINYCLYRCMALAEAGDFVVAVEEYQKARAILAGQPDEEGMARLMTVIQNLGVLLEAHEEYRDTALDLYRELMDAGYHSAVLYNRMGLNRMEAGDYDGALQLFEQGIKAGNAQEIKELRYHQAVAYEYKSDFKKALELFEAYQAEYGEDEDVIKEINFLRTR